MDSIEARGRKFDAWAATRSGILEIDAANENYPSYFLQAQGPYLWDINGKQYIDLIMGYGPVVLGHADRRVNQAVINQIEKGVCFSPGWSTVQVELTELLVEKIPSAEQAYLMKTGSDATSAAVRLARIFTGRNKVIRWGYHGWHDWSAPRRRGIPAYIDDDIYTFEYNNISSLNDLFEQNRNQVACVIMMPFEYDIPQEGFLKQVQNLCKDNGALFVLDEMRSGFRIDLSGAQGFFDLDPDLSTFSKAMSNGFAISALVGKQHILECIQYTHMSSTFFANPMEMAAALATIEALEEQDVSKQLWEDGEYLMKSLTGIVNRFALPAKIRGYPISPFLEFDSSDDAQRVKTRFFDSMIQAGVYIHPNHQWFLSAAHRYDDLKYVVDAFNEAADFSVK